MSLATRCPACGTTFRIEPEQLALADGWARCGRCSTVFDAAATQRPEVANEAPVEPSTPSGALSPPVPPTPAFDPWRELPSLSLGPDPAAPPPVPVPVPVPDHPLPPAVAAEAPTADEPATQPPAPSGSAGPSWPVPPSGSSGPASGPSGVRPAVRAESVAPSGVIHAASEPVNDAGVAARKPRGDTGRRRSWRLAILLLAIVLLLLALLAQVLYRQRDAVAARHPALRPALAAVCGFAGCRIAPLRRPGDIAIEGGTFVHAQDSDRYRLDFALRNQADVPLAMPAIELSLLDAQERTVVRRVLMPAEFGVAETTLPALAERAGTVSFDLDEGAATGAEPSPRIAGYAMVAFYP